MVGDVAGEERTDGDDRQRDGHEGPRDPAEPQRRSLATEVDAPGGHHAAQTDEAVGGDVPAEAGQGPRPGFCAVGEELVGDEAPDDCAEDGEQGRPRQPVAEHGQWAGQGEVLSPAFPGVERDPRLVGEHGRRLGVDVRLQQSQDCRAGPQDRRPNRSQGNDREANPDQIERRLGQAEQQDGVPPAHGLGQRLGFESDSGAGRGGH